MNPEPTSATMDALRRSFAAKVHCLIINNDEVFLLTGEHNLIRGARKIQDMGPTIVAPKKGEHGVLMFSDAGSFAAPAYPLEDVFDPTGAGDTFAGGFLGYLASSADGGEATLRKAVIMGSALASFCVEAFSPDRLLRLTRPEIDERFRLFKKLTHFEGI